MVGVCLAIPLRPRLFGACRIVAKDRKYGFVVEGVNWFGSRLPTLKEIERAAPLKNPADVGRIMCYFLLDSPNRLPRGYIVVGQSKQSFEFSFHSGIWWEGFQEKLLAAWAKKQGRNVYATIFGEERRRLAKRAQAAGVNPKLFQFKEEADEVLSMWKKDEYDNTKDAILDARGLLADARRLRLSDYTKKLTKMLNQATSELRAVVKEDPSMASYAKGLLPKTRLKKKKPPKK